MQQYTKALSNLASLSYFSVQIFRRTYLFVVEYNAAFILDLFLWEIPKEEDVGLFCKNFSHSASSFRRPAENFIWEEQISDGHGYWMPIGVRASEQQRAEVWLAIFCGGEMLSSTFPYVITTSAHLLPLPPSHLSSPFSTIVNIW